jgi:hypothetical protein
VYDRRGSANGIPQKKGSADDAETIGFQRDENKKRIESIVAFMKDHHNVIQNPLLCAKQYDKCGKVHFVSDSSSEQADAQSGQVHIEVDDFSAHSMLDLMRHVKTLLESRVPELSDHVVAADFVNTLKQQVEFIGDTDEDDDLGDDDDDDDDEIDEDTEDNGSKEATEIVFSDESHILEFWQDLSARIQILDELGTDFTDDSFLGYSRESMISFLKPVVVMDGQHRLRGALLTAKRIANQTPEFQQQIETAIEAGEDSAEVQARFERTASRLLPEREIAQESDRRGASKLRRQLRS